MPSPLLPLPQGCLYKATLWQQQMPIRTVTIIRHPFLFMARSLASLISILLSFRALSTPSIHPNLGLPLALLPSTFAFITFFSSRSLSILSTWPNHLKIFIYTLAANSLLTPVLALTTSFLTLSNRDTPVILLRHFISNTFRVCLCYFHTPWLWAIHYSRHNNFLIPNFLNIHFQSSILHYFFQKAKNISPCPDPPPPPPQKKKRNKKKVSKCGWTVTRKGTT